MTSSQSKKLSIEGKGLRYRLLIVEALVFVLPSLALFCIFYDNNILLESSQVAIFAVVLTLILLGLIILRQIFDRVFMVKTLMKKALDGDKDLTHIQEDKDEVHEIMVSFNTLMKRFEDTTSELRRRVFELFAVKELTEVACKSLDIDDLLKLLLEKTMAVSRARIGCVFLVESEKVRFRIAASKGLDSIPQKDSYLNVSESLAQRVVHDKKPILVQDIETNSRTRTQNDPKYETSSLSMPIFIGEDLIAVLNLSQKETLQVFDSNDEQIMSIMIGQIGFALENARLHSGLEKHLRDLQERTAELSKVNDQLQQEIADRNQAEDALRESEMKYRTLFGLCPQAIAVTEVSNDRLIEVNDEFCAVTKYTREEILGRTTTECRFYSKEDRDRFVRALDMGSGEVHGLEMDFTAKDGSILTTFIFSKLIWIAGESCILTIFLDLTERKRLEAQLLKAQKMEAIGTLAGGIAHDFNNLLMGAQGNVSLMLLDMDSTHPNYERLKNVEKQIESGAALTSRLLGYARKGKYEVKPIDLNQVVRQTSDAFGRIRKQITIHQELAEDLFAIEADPGQTEQVIWNLLVNAADAMERGGNLILKTTNVTHKHMQGRLYDPTPGNYVLITVTDTGAGMDKETLERIFDPFFTTKEMGSGTGLGLATAYGIIKAHGGYIDVESKKGHGTTFSIYLPASEEKVEEVVKTAVKIIKGTGTVLLVDDEQVILEVGQDLLETMGYRVLIARDGKEAVEVYGKNRDEIDIVILDMVMPVMGGGEVYDRLKEVNPDITVLLSSGYSIDGEATEILERGCDGFIQKPFRMNELSGKIREILEKK